MYCYCYNFAYYGTEFYRIAYANETKVPNTTVEYIDVAEVAI